MVSLTLLHVCLATALHWTSCPAAAPEASPGRTFVLLCAVPPLDLCLEERHRPIQLQTCRHVLGLFETETSAMASSTRFHQTLLYRIDECGYYIDKGCIQNHIGLCHLP
jgi:hypothetical protein